MAKRCPRCDGSMTQGATMHRDSGSGVRSIHSWLEGPIARYPRWLGGSVRLSGKKPAEIETWRCNRCHYLESYAPDRKT